MGCSESAADDEGRFDEVREAAEAVLASLKWLVEAAERVIEDPGAPAAAAAAGRSFVDTLTRGFRFSYDRSGPEDPAADQYERAQMGRPSRRKTLFPALGSLRSPGRSGHGPANQAVRAGRSTAYLRGL